MMLTLTIENTECLPTGVPARVQLRDRGHLTIGRAGGLGWTLPDPYRFISGKHCEIHGRAGTYWLYDVSTNGTFMNGEPDRIAAARPLRHGDRLAIGVYVITVAIEPEPAAAWFSAAQDQTVYCADQPFQYHMA